MPDLIILVWALDIALLAAIAIYVQCTINDFCRDAEEIIRNVKKQ